MGTKVILAERLTSNCLKLSITYSVSKNKDSTLNITVMHYLNGMEILSTCCSSHNCKSK